MIATRLPALIAELRRVVGSEAVLANHSDRVVFECDGFVIEKNCPDVVVFPRSAQQISEIVKLCNEYDIPYLPRGAGTSLAGGCLPVGGGVMLVLTRMKEILEINLRDRYAVVEPVSARPARLTTVASSLVTGKTMFGCAGRYNQRMSPRIFGRMSYR